MTFNSIISYLPSSRDRTYVTIDQIEEEFPDFIDKIEEIYTDSDYSSVSKNIAKGVCSQLEIWENISWKQFDMIMNMYKTPPRRNKRGSSSNRSFGWDFPTGNEKMEDYVHFGINFKGLSI